MKKYILSLLLVATLVAAFIVPTMGDGDVEDTFPGNATLYLTHSDQSMYAGMSGHLNYTLEDGYLFMKTDTHIQSPNKVDGTEILNVVAVNGSSLDNIESFEYKDSTDGAWTNAFNYIVNTNRSFTQRLSISRFYRVKFKGDVSLEMQYKVKPEGAKGYESGLRCISIVKNEDNSFTADATFIKAEDITTTQATSATTVAPTAEPVTGETASEATTAAPTKAPAVKAPGKAKIKKVWKKKRSAKKLKIKLAKVKNAKGYKVCVYKNKKKAKKHKKAIVTKYTTKLKYTIKSKKLKNKKKLFVGARAYNVASNGIKVYGPWAKIKKVKVK